MKTMGMGGADHETPEELKATCAELKAADERAAKIGMSVYYHNHCSEFEPISDGVIPFDELKKAAHLEIDTYWSFVASQDNYKLITENRDEDSSRPCQGRPLRLPRLSARATAISLRSFARQKISASSG